MLQIVGKDYLPDYLLVATALAYGKIDKAILEIAKRLKKSRNYQYSDASISKKIKMVCHAIDEYLTTAALKDGLYFRESKKLAVISGAGIAGLAASFELRARGFNVVIAEKRESSSRFNIINLSVETRAFLKKFNLLENFEKFVAARIKEHKYVVIEKTKSARLHAVSDVSGLQLDEFTSFEIKNFNKLFNQDGIYSVPIGVLQSFLAQNALYRGVEILGNAAVRILSRTQAGGVSKVKVTVYQVLKPDLFFIAEGAHSTTAAELGIETKRVTNACSGENWIFGNMSYSGKETFVISLVDTSAKSLRIANVIFNAKCHMINIAVTSSKRASEDEIKNQILNVAGQVFDQEVCPLEKMNSTLLSAVRKPVNIVNRILSTFSMDNVFCIGDSAGSSSPLAGLGGTLGLTLVPSTVNQLLDDYDRQSSELHHNFNAFSDAYARRWILKSESIKNFCLGLFDKEQIQA